MMSTTNFYSGSNNNTIEKGPKNIGNEEGMKVSKLQVKKRMERPMSST